MLAHFSMLPIFGICQYTSESSLQIPDPTKAKKRSFPQYMSGNEIVPILDTIMLTVETFQVGYYHHCHRLCVFRNT